MERFGCISEIDVNDELSWKGRIFITLDVDWADDKVIEYSISMLQEYGIKATWFITHDSPIVERLRENSNFELGIHPNFNKLLAGDFALGKTADEIVKNIMDIVPEAKSVRSHSMTQNSVILDVFKKFGLTHDCNHFIPHQSGVSNRPWKHWNGLIKVPYLWEDDVASLYNDFSMAFLSSDKCVKVLDFHPIHIFLNTKDLSVYENTRHLHRNARELKFYTNKGEIGSMRFLERVMRDFS